MSRIPMGLFRLGNIVASASALQSLTHEEMVAALRRHQAGDWGDLDEDDKCKNNQTLVEGGRIMSLYHAAGDRQFGILTEADRSETTIFLAERVLIAGLSMLRGFFLFHRFSRPLRRDRMLPWRCVHACA